MTICLNSKVNGKQPSLEYRIYWCGGIAPAITTCFFYSVLVYENNSDSETRAEATKKILRLPHGFFPGAIVDLIPTLTIRSWQHNNFVFEIRNMCKRFRIRRLTPVECMRIMDVPDKDIQTMKNAGISDSQLYKLAGNSIVVACLKGIFSQMFATTPVGGDTLFG